MKYQVIVFIFFLFAANGYSQEKISYAEVDSITLSLYLEKEWKEVVRVGNMGIEQGIDYYYLRMRIGISYYERKKYMMAIPHFEEALKFNSNDAVVEEYLYFSYLFSGLESNATWLASSFVPSLRKKCDLDSTFTINTACLEGGYTFNPDYTSVRNSSMGSYNFYNERTLFRDSYFGSLTLSHPLFARNTVTHCFTQLRRNNLQQIEEQDIGKRQFLHQTTQNNYYLNISRLMENDWRGYLAANILWVNKYENNVTYDSVGIWEIPLLTNEEYSAQEYIVAGGLSKRLKRAEIGIFGSFSNLNGGKQRQLGGNMTLFPLANMNLYSSSTLSFNKEASSLIKVKPNFVFEETLGFKVLNKLWVEGNITFGELKNFNASGGYLIYNDANGINKKTGISLISPLTSSIEISLRFTNLQKESWALTYTDETIWVWKAFISNENSCVGSIKLKF